MALLQLGYPWTSLSLSLLGLEGISEVPDMICAHRGSPLSQNPGQDLESSRFTVPAFPAASAWTEEPGGYCPRGGKELD